MSSYEHFLFVTIITNLYFSFEDDFKNKQIVGSQFTSNQDDDVTKIQESFALEVE